MAIDYTKAATFLAEIATDGLATALKGILERAVQEERERCAAACEQLESRDRSKLRREAFREAAVAIRTGEEPALMAWRRSTKQRKAMARRKRGRPGEWYGGIYCCPVSTPFPTWVEVPRMIEEMAKEAVFRLLVPR